MSYAERHTIALTTDADGNATGYTARPITGRIEAVIYTKTDFADGVDFDVDGETTGLPIWAEDNVNASAVRYPRAATHSTAGAAALYAAGGAAVLAPIVVANERIRAVVANGGNTKTGAITIIVS